MGLDETQCAQNVIVAYLFRGSGDHALLHLYYGHNPANRQIYFYIGVERCANRKMHLLRIQTHVVGDRK